MAVQPASDTSSSSTGVGAARSAPLSVIACRPLASTPNRSPLPSTVSSLNVTVFGMRIPRGAGEARLLARASLGTSALSRQPVPLPDRRRVLRIRDERQVQLLVREHVSSLEDLGRVVLEQQVGQV